MFNNFCSNVIFFNKFCKGDNWRFLRRGSPSYNVPGKNHFVYLSCVNYSLSKAFQFADLTLNLLSYYLPWIWPIFSLTRHIRWVWPKQMAMFGFCLAGSKTVGMTLTIFGFVSSSSSRIEINYSFTLSLLSLQEKKKEDLASGQEVGDKVILW